MPELRNVPFLVSVSSSECPPVVYCGPGVIVPVVSCVPCIVQELCESGGGRPGLSVLTSLLVSVDVKLY